VLGATYSPSRSAKSRETSRYVLPFAAEFPNQFAMRFITQRSRVEIAPHNKDWPLF
jgi:hypothetical protein